MTIIKICGITNAPDALAAADMGADALGFIFVPASPRYISPEAASSIIRSLPPFVTPVGVFVNARREHIMDLIHATGIRSLQLHGEEPPDEVAGYPVPVCKAFRVADGFNPEILGRYGAAAFLLDSFLEGQHGGTGRVFDWSIARGAKRFGRIIVGGGISPDNVLDVIREASPYAVDVNSGVEVAPGKKDIAKLRRLFKVLQRTDCH